MAKKATPLVWLCKTAGGWKRYPVIMAKNGRVKTGFVLVDGKEMHYPEGRFQIRTFEGGKRVWQNAGEDAVDALAMRDRLARRNDIVAQAQVAGVEIKEEQGRMPLRASVTKYLKRCLEVDAEEAEKSYRVALDDFIRSVPDLQFVDQVNEETLIKYGAALKKSGNSERTVFNKHRVVLGFLRWCNVDVKALRIRTPRFEKKLPVVYSDETAAALIKATTDPYYRVVLDVLRMTGLREQEAVHLQWADIDFKRKMVLVRSKPEFGFKIKDREQRDVPMPEALATVLKEWFLVRGDSKLVLGTEDGKPHQKWLRLLKRTARKAGLNCGRCDGCKDQNECRMFTLHSFRRSYATSLHRKGVDVRTLMALLGHSDIETTMAYLAPMKAEETHAQISSAFE
jgi:integrase